MQEKRRFKLNKLWLAAALSVLAILAVIGATQAWFIRNRETDSEALNVQTGEAPLSMESYTVYLWTRDGSGNEVCVASDSMEHMLAYDAVFGKNDHTPVYVVIPVALSDAEPNATLEVTLHLDDDVIFTDNAHTLVASKISNIISYDAICVNSCITGNTVEALWSNIHAAFSGSTSAQTFVSCAKTAMNNRRYQIATDAVKQEDLSFRFATTAASMDADGYTYIYVKIDYEWPLIDSFLYSHRNENFARRLDSTNTVEFTNDIDTIEISIPDV